MTAVQAGAKAVLKAVARLHPDEALEVLEPMARAERQGIRKRVLLAARIALMRKAMAAPARVVAEPVAEVVPEVVQEVVDTPPAPPPEPKPLPKGRIMSINLDDLASMLSEPAEPVDGAQAAAKPSSETGDDSFAPLDWGNVAGTLDPQEAEMPGVALEQVAQPVPGGASAKSSRGKKRGAVVAIGQGDAATGAAGIDAAAVFAAMEGDDAPPAPVAVDAAAVFAAMEEEAGEFPAQPAEVGVAALEGMEEAEVVEVSAAGDGPARAAPVAVADAAALFAAMEDDAPEVSLAKPVVVDVAAAFAAFGGEAEDAPAATLTVDPSAAFAALEDAGLAETQAISVPARPPVVDAGAAFAALEAAEEEEARALAPAPGKKAKPLAVDLSAQFAAMDDE